MEVLRYLLLFSFFGIFLAGCSSEEDSPEQQAAEVIKTQPVMPTTPQPTPEVQTGSEPPAAPVEQDLSVYEGVSPKVLDISERAYDGGNALAVTFSVPLDPSRDYSSYFSVYKNGGEGYVDSGWVLSENGKIMYFPDTQPNASYRVEVERGLKAINGEKLEESAESTVKTRHLSASISFTSKGNFLTRDLEGGLPIASVNVNEVDVNFHRVKADQLTYFLHQIGSRQQLRPWYTEQVAHFTDLVHSARYTLNPPENKRRNYALPVSDIEALTEPGIYLAVMSEPGEYNQQLSVTYFTVTDIGLHIRRSQSQLTVFASSLQTGEAMPKLEIDLLGVEGKRLGTRRTDANGEVRFSQFKQAEFVVAQHGNDITVVNLTQPALDLSDFELGMRPFRSRELFLYGPRDLYRPGEEVTISALLRDFDARATRATPLKAKITRPDGQTVREFSWHAQENGYYETRQSLDSNAQTGTWKLEVAGIDAAPVIYEFKVEEFMPERMKLTFNSGQESTVFAADENVSISVLGEYLYGAPAAGNRFEPQVSVSRDTFAVESLKGFHFGDASDSEQFSGQFSLDDITLSATGHGDIRIPSRWKDTRSPLVVRLRGSLYESGGRPVTRTHTAQVWPAQKLPGIRAQFVSTADSHSDEPETEQNSMADFEIVYADKNGQRFAADDLEVVLLHVDRRYFWEFSQAEGWHYERVEQEYPVLSQNVSIEEGEAAKLSVPVEYGAYRLEVRDIEHNTLSSLTFRAGPDWYYWWRHNQQAGQAARPDKVSLAWDKGAYRPGDTAVLSIVPPEAGEVLVMIEADKPLFVSRQFMPKEGGSIEIPIDDDWNRHDLYASVVHLRPGDKAANITPHRSFGLLHLPLNNDSRQLAVDVAIDDKIVPNQQHNARISVKGAQGQAYVTLAAVDVGVLSITDFETPDPFAWFFEPRRYQTDVFDMYHKLVELNDNPMARQRFGGDAELSRGGKQAQADVRIVSLFSGLVTLNENGEADVALNIPDFNGRLRLMAVAFTDEQYGHAEKEVTVAAPLVTQISMPRFLSPDDGSTLAVDIHNLSEEAVTLDVRLSADGPVELLAHANDPLQLAINEKATLLFPVRASYPQENSSWDSQIRLAVDGLASYPVKQQWRLSVRPAYPAVSQRLEAVLEQGENLTLAPEQLDDLVQESIEARVSLNNVVDLRIQSQLTHLLRYPYGCLEQTTSSTYPWLFATNENLTRMGLKGKSQEERNNSIERGLARLAERQHSNGAYGLWSNNGQEEHWLTAYVGNFLVDAREQGVDVGKEQFNSTLRRLEDYLKKRNGNLGYRYTESTDHYALAYRAYAGYVLARLNRARLGDLRTLAKDSSHAKGPLPLVHLALALHMQGDKTQAETLLNQALVRQRDREHYYGDYGSPTRDAALSIYLMLKHDFHVDKAKAMTLELADNMRARRYLSTQERNAVFLAGLALGTAFKEEWSADLALGSAIESIQHAGDFARKYEYGDLTQDLSVTNTDSDLLFASIEYLGYSKAAPKPETNGFSIQRIYYSPEGKRITPAELQVGDLVVVYLNVETKEREPDALVVDLLPAGLELENQNLAHAVKLDDVKVDDKPLDYWFERTRIIHQEYRDDRYVAAVDIDRWSPARLVYLARAVTPGEYTVPPPFVEDMYNPEQRAIGQSLSRMRIVQPENSQPEQAQP